VALIGAGGLYLVVALAAEGGAAAALGIVLVPAFVLLYLVFVRVQPELIAVIFRIGENTSTLVWLSAQPQRGQIGPEQPRFAPPPGWAPPPEPSRPE